MIKTYILIISTIIISILIFNIIGNSCNKVNKNSLIQHFTNGSTRGRWIGGIKILPNSENEATPAPNAWDGMTCQQISDTYGTSGGITWGSLPGTYREKVNGNWRGSWSGGMKYWYDKSCNTQPGEAKVSKFKLKYSRDGTNWFDIDNSNEFTNSGDNDGNVYFNTPVYAKKIRLLPTECVNRCTIKFDYLEHSGKDASGANLPIPVDCKVSEWSDTSCSKTCGGGTLTKTRTIVRQSQNNGLPCPSDLIKEDVPCNQQTCAPEPCEISQWSEWSSCSKTCGGGTRTKTRTITQQPKYNGAVCPSDLEITGDCNIDPCPVDCVVGDWSDWSECNKFCGGGNRTRNKPTTAPAHGGTACPPASELTASAPCGEQECVASDQKMYVVQPNSGNDNTCQNAGDHWGEVGNLTGRFHRGYFGYNIIGGAGGHRNHKAYHATQLVKLNKFDADKPNGCDDEGSLAGCRVPDYGRAGDGAYGVTLCKSDSRSNDFVKKTDYFTTEACLPEGVGEKLASKISFKANKPNGKYNLCRADLSKQGAIDFFKTIEDNHSVLKYRNNCNADYEKAVWDGGNSIKLCGYKEPMFLIHKGSFDTIPNDWVGWGGSNTLGGGFWVQEYYMWLMKAILKNVVKGKNNYAFPQQKGQGNRMAGCVGRCDGGIRDGTLIQGTDMRRSRKPWRVGTALVYIKNGWGTSPRKHVGTINMTKWGGGKNNNPYPTIEAMHLEHGVDRKIDITHWIYKNPSLFVKGGIETTIDLHQKFNITSTTTLNNSGLTEEFFIPQYMHKTITPINLKEQQAARGCLGLQPSAHNNPLCEAIIIPFDIIDGGLWKVKIWVYKKNEPNIPSGIVKNLDPNSILIGQETGRGNPNTKITSKTIILGFNPSFINRYDLIHNNEVWRELYN
jgi:hypothetical protein